MEQQGLRMPGSAQAPSLIMQPTRPTSIGGLVSVQSASQVLADQAMRDKAMANASKPMEQVVNNLAYHVRTCWDKAKRAKLPIEEKMLKAVRSRRGEYDPEVLNKIREQGGSEIYMMLFSTKARQAGALIRDTTMGNGVEKPWTIRPTAKPDINPETASQIMQTIYSLVLQAEESGMPMDPAQVRQMMLDARASAETAVMQEAKDRAHDMETAMEDQLQEGGFQDAYDQFVDDMTTFKTAFLKGPVLRKRTKMAWVQDATGYKLDMQEKILPEWERVDPFNVYPAPWSRGVNDAWLIERHQLSRESLEAMIGVEGYSDKEIRAVMDEAGINGLHEWLQIDSSRAQAEGRMNSGDVISSDLIDALQFWGPVSGKSLVEWGMSKDQVIDQAKVYEAEVWLIGSHVIKASLNKDPVKRRPYYATGYERVPGAFWHNSLFDIVEDCQAMCNAAARSLANNMGISSGPQVVINVDRLPADEEVTNMFPWKLWQATSDPMGSTAPPITFFQPSSNADELMRIYQQFSLMADEVSGIPRYMTGTEGTPGAGRTASGLSMMIGNASKTIKNVVSNIDVHIFSPLLERQYFHNMRYSEDENLKGDVNIVARGALSLTVKESAQVRRNEFLQATGNPIDMQIVGMEGRAYMLREAARALDMDTDKIVPPDSVLKARAQQAQAAQQAQMAQQAQGQQPGPPAGNGQELMNGAPVTDNF